MTDKYPYWQKILALPISTKAAIEALMNTHDISVSDMLNWGRNAPADVEKVLTILQLTPQDLTPDFWQKCLNDTKTKDFAISWLYKQNYPMDYEEFLNKLKRPLDKFTHFQEIVKLAKDKNQTQHLQYILTERLEEAQITVIDILRFGRNSPADAEKVLAAWKKEPAHLSSKVWKEILKNQETMEYGLIWASQYDHTLDLKAITGCLKLFSDTRNMKMIAHLLRCHADVDTHRGAILSDALDKKMYPLIDMVLDYTKEPLNAYALIWEMPNRLKDQSVAQEEPYKKVLEKATILRDKALLELAIRATVAEPITSVDLAISPKRKKAVLKV